MKKLSYSDYPEGKLKKLKTFHSTLVVTLIVIMLLYISIAGYFIGVEGMPFSPILGIGLLVIFSGTLVPITQLSAINSELRTRNEI